MLENETSLILLYSPPRCFLLAPRCCSEASQKQLAPREWLVGKKGEECFSLGKCHCPHICVGVICWLLTWLWLQSRLPKNDLKDLTAFSWSRHPSPVSLFLTETQRWMPVAKKERQSNWTWAKTSAAQHLSALRSEKQATHEKHQSCLWLHSLRALGYLTN